jgi:segregation and condensation protein B
VTFLVDDNIKYIVEAMLLAYTEGLQVNKIAEVLKRKESTIKQAINELSIEYKENNRGYIIKEIKDTYQLVTNPIYHKYLEKLFENVQRQNLSQAALEVLAIVGYKQPVTKSKIEEIRGVSCEKVISRLLEKNLLEEIGRLDAPGKPILYGTTNEFLRLFGIKDTTMLPPIEEFHKLIKEEV